MVPGLPSHRCSCHNPKSQSPNSGTHRLHSPEVAHTMDGVWAALQNVAIGLNPKTAQTPNPSPHHLQSPKVVHALDGVWAALHHVAKLVACALELLAVELHNHEGVKSGERRTCGGRFPAVSLLL